MRNRKQPFGYTMTSGEVRINPPEADLVRCLFQQYRSGASFNELVAMLDKQTVHYIEGKPWNKNMVARILNDERYVGDSGLPPIISKYELETAMQIRVKKQASASKTSVQKVLRQLSGQTAEPWMERRVLGLLNKLSKQPELIRSPASPLLIPCKVVELENELSRVASEFPVNEPETYRLICAIAAEQYKTIPASDYETERIKRIVKRTGQMKTLNTNVLSAVVSEVQFVGSNIMIRLKNNQIIKGADSNGR